MKILIVDDESLIRRGLETQIDWESLHIDSVLQADDGLRALELARRERPEIVLTDVRMPHMDGIAFAQACRSLLPECHIIFMSGYSDKDYLKAAIRLKAVSYVEKPIDLDEIRDAIREAVRLYAVNERNKDAQDLRIREESIRLAVALTHPQPPEQTRQLCASLGLAIGETTPFITLVVRMALALSDLPEEQSAVIHARLAQFCGERGLSFLMASKYDEYLILHLYAKGLREADAQDFARFLQELMRPCAPFSITIGPPVTGFDHVHTSYENAVLLLDAAFFCKPNEILSGSRPAENLNAFLERCPAEFTAALTGQDWATAQKAAQRFYESLSDCRSLLPAQAKDIYYRLLMALESTELERQLGPAPEQESYTTWDAVVRCGNLSELHALLTEKLARVAESARHPTDENHTVFLMKEYIRRKFAVDTLSVKDVSDFVFLNTAYACTLFKNETGRTINQYLTDFRLEKARQLLADPRYKITDISARVGYADGNYFGKLFKKFVGLSPSKYREKML